MEFEKSASEIQNEMLSEISNSYEKSKGYFLWDILKAIAIGLRDLTKGLQIVSDKLDVENMSGDELERFIYQRTGIKRKEVSFAVGVVTVKGNGTVNIGDFFETEGFIRFEATETVEVVEEADVNVRAVIPGASGNVPEGTIIKMPVTIAGISECTNKKATSEGYDAEADTDLLTRYYERLQIPATSGNVYHYRQWAKEVQGVGEAKVFPLWNGNNTVLIVIIDSNRKPASEELVKNVQDYIDPGITGTGEGEAPIGAFCTVQSATGKEISLSVKVVLQKDADLEIVTKSIKENIEKYLKDIAFVRNYLSYAVVGATILDTDGVLDYENLLVNEGTGNVECDDKEVMILGSVQIEQ